MSSHSDDIYYVSRFTYSHTSVCNFFDSIWAPLATTLTTEFMYLLRKSILVFVTWHDKVVCRRQQQQQHFSVNAFNTVISGKSYKRLCKRLGWRLDVRDHYIGLLHLYLHPDTWISLVTNSVPSHRVCNFRVHSVIGQTSIALQQTSIIVPVEVDFLEQLLKWLFYAKLSSFSGFWFFTVKHKEAITRNTNQPPTLHILVLLCKIL